MEELKGNDFLLDGYIPLGEPKVMTIGGCRYSLQCYQGVHEDEFTLKKDGRVCLYQNGILKMCYDVDEGDGQIGDFTQYEKGCVSFVQSCEDIWDSSYYARVVNHVRGQRMEIYSHETDHLIYHGEFNEQWEREGWGIEYDEESGAMLLEGMWKGNKLVEVIRKIEGNIMTEFKRNGDNTNAFNRIPVYVGEFVYDESKESFIRNGQGNWISEETRIATREVEWKDGVEVSGRDLYDGWYTRSTALKPKSKLKRATKPVPDAVPAPKREAPAPKREAPAPKHEAPAPKHEEPAPLRIDVTESTRWRDVSLQVTDLTISWNYGSDLKALDLNRFEWLQSIEIGNNCFESVQTFKIDGLNRLKTIKIGINSFTQEKNDDGNDASKSFHILNCESLESIQIGEYSFSDFAGEFELKNLLQLQSIQIGTIGSWSSSYNFYYSSFVIRGIDMKLNIVMIRSSKSTIHYIG